MDQNTAITNREQAEDTGYANGLERLIDDVRAAPSICEDEFLGAIVATPDEALGHDILSMASDDPILASLIKQYLNASRQHKGLLRSHGTQDAMVEVAADMVDSAWCALQTRLLELRAAQSQDQSDRAMTYGLAARTAETEQPEPAQPKDDFVAFLMWLAVMWPDLKNQPKVDPRLNFSIAAAGRI